MNRKGKKWKVAYVGQVSRRRRRQWQQVKDSDELAQRMRAILMQLKAEFAHMLDAGDTLQSGDFSRFATKLEGSSPPLALPFRIPVRFLSAGKQKGRCGTVGPYSRRIIMDSISSGIFWSAI